jgi:hypothetical protein
VEFGRGARHLVHGDAYLRDKVRAPQWHSLCGYDGKPVWHFSAMSADSVFGVPD